MDPVSLAPAVLTVLVPCLAKAGGKLADALVENAPEYAGKLWTAIAEKFRDKPAAEEAARDLLENPADADSQAAFRKELRKAAEGDPASGWHFWLICWRKPSRKLRGRSKSAGIIDIIGNKNLDADENGQERILRFFSAYSALVRVPKMALTNYQ